MPITTEVELLQELGVAKLLEVVKHPEAEARLIQLAPDLSPELVALVLRAVPELAQAFNSLIGSIENVGKSLEETKRMRWKILHDLAETDRLSADQILEAMRIIADIEKSEGIDWTSVFKRVAETIGVVIVLVVGGILIAVGLGGRGGGAGPEA